MAKRMTAADKAEVEQSNFEINLQMTIDGLRNENKVIRQRLRILTDVFHAAITELSEV